ncbi:hypothetical protein C8Q74DRAFT_1219603 [Fomes fomentarius]|nr:hypothetical protein C8Q74DRAFT_1219603 [Fomes fomentarius]
MPHNAVSAWSVWRLTLPGHFSAALAPPGSLSASWSVWRRLIPPSATAPNPSEEEGNIPAQEVPGSPMQQDLHVSRSMLNEAVSPSLSAQLGSSPRSQSSHMSVDPAPFQLDEQVASVPELYDLDGEPLAAWGLLINRRLKAFICLACQAVVLPSHIQGHLSQQHKGFKARIDMQVIDQAVATEGICEDWPAIPAAMPLQFQGLSLLTGYECPVCTVIHPGFKSLQNHARQSHSVTLPSNGRYQICDCQQLSKHPAARSWFPVHRYAPPPVTSFSPYLSTLREQLDIPAVIPFSEVDHRQVNPWQATTRWGEWVATQDPALLMQLVEYPKPNSDLANLGPIVQRFLNRVYNFIPVAGELCCQILNTETPTSDYNHTPFNQHQVHDSFKAYSRVAVQLIAFIIRASSHPTYRCGWHEGISDLMQAFANDIQDEDVNAAEPVDFDDLGLPSA